MQFCKAPFLASVWTTFLFPQILCLEFAILQPEAPGLPSNLKVHPDTPNQPPRNLPVLSHSSPILKRTLSKHATNMIKNIPMTSVETDFQLQSYQILA